MVADLLELGQRGQDQPAPLDALRRLDAFQHVVDHRLVERGLLGGQVADTSISSFSGRSAMIDLSVFSRRRMNGPVNGAAARPPRRRRGARSVRRSAS